MVRDLEPVSCAFRLSSSVRSKGRTRSKRHRHEPDPLARRVGGRIRELRIERDFTFDAFVEECGLGRGYVSELERGLVVPSLTTLATVARVLDVTVADLVAGASPREALFVETRGLPQRVIARLLVDAQRQK